MPNDPVDHDTPDADGCLPYDDRCKQLARNAKLATNKVVGRTHAEAVNNSDLTLHGQYYNQVPDMLADKTKQLIHIFHVPTGKKISFPAFLTDFKDNYKTDYTKENVFGRMDPITTFKSIQRNISLGFTIP